MSGETKLLVCGGGPLPGHALRTFFSSHLDTPDTLIVAWASRFPDSACVRSARKLGLQLESALVSRVPPLTSREVDRFLVQLRQARKIFFTGGDQNRVMDALDAYPEVSQALHSAYLEGVLFSGTSAGTAIMSSIMISGEMSGHNKRPILRRGLGLLSSAVLDQHFIKRQRHERLEHALTLSDHHLGIGVDEGAALLIQDTRYASVVCGKVVVMEKGSCQTIRHKLYRAGHSWDLGPMKRQPVLS